MIDLHMHSTCSDGTDEVEKLIENINKKGVDCFSLTDHDTAEGCRRILSEDALKTKLSDYKIDFVSGAEWTCIYGGQKMHILTYGFNPFDEVVLNLEKEMRNLLDRKDEFRKEELEKKGFILSDKSKQYLSTKENVRSLDFARCLVDDGYFSNLQEAFKECLNKLKPPFQTKLDAVDVIIKMKSIGAKVVWAHSIYDMKRKITPFEEVERIIKELRPYGLDGLECYYSLYSKGEIDRLIEIAKRNDLFITSGSDYHGENKEVAIGCFSADGTNPDLSNIKIYDIFKNIVRNS